MVDLGRRPLGRLCCLALVMTCFAVAAFAQTGTTTVADTVYLADGTKAQGTLLIMWPAFITGGGTAVAAGTTSTTLGSNGALSIGLIPNAGATPAGVYYTVVYQLGPGQVKTEFWLVPTTSPANLATVRTTPGSGAAGQPVSMQYVNSALATKANDSAVVHLSGSETINGAKSFATAPNVPAPTSTGQVANKAYVDQSVSNVGAGNYLPTAGGTMTGPITLPADPVAAMQVATKEYVDTGFASKADLLAGLVPSRELGSGVASTGSCLLGNGTSGTWGACGGGGGTGNMSTNPAGSQNIAQPQGTQFSTNNLANIRYVTSSWNWAQTPADNLATPGNATIHLSPCPLGIDATSSANYYTYKVYISGQGTPEAVAVTGGSCTPGASSGTITVTTANAHAAGYTVGSASSGVQEAWNDAWVNDWGSAPDAQGLPAPYVKLMSDTEYDIHATVYLRGRGGVLDATGSWLVCSTRDRCIYIGITEGRPYVNHHKLYNLTATSAITVDGVQVAGISAASGLYTITTASSHPFVAGDTVDCEYHSPAGDQHWASPVLSTGLTGTQFQVSFGSASLAAGGKTFGFCNILNAFIEDNSDHVVIQDVNIMQSNPPLGYFSYGIVNDNDQAMVIARASNRSSAAVISTPNWPIGAFVYQRIDQGNAGIVWLHDSEFSNMNCLTGGGNGLVVTDSVCQGFPMYGFRYLGGLQPATFQNVYQESTGATLNPLYSPTVVQSGAAQMGYALKGGLGNRIVGSFPASGASPRFLCNAAGSGAVRSYFVVPRGNQGYGPVLYIGAATACDNGPIHLAWPSVNLVDIVGATVGTLTWDVLVTTGAGTMAPANTGNFAVATGISGSCGTNGMCSYTDTQSAPSSYTVQSETFAPLFWFWPVTYVIENTTLVMDQSTTVPSSISSLGILNVSIVAEQCKSAGPPSEQRSPIWMTCLSSDGAGASGTIATVLQEHDTAGGGPVPNSKGRLNFSKPISAPNDLITLQDSNFAKTVSTTGERPSNDAGDMAIGLDQAGGLAQRAATSISSYINAAPSGTNYAERLTAAAKTFNVPVTVNGNLSVTSGTVTLPVTGSGSQCLHVSATGAVSGTGADCGSGGGGSGTVNGGLTSQVAMYSGSGTSVSGDSALTDSGTTLNYAGSGGIAAASGTFSGNLTVNGQLLVAGPWMVSSPVPGTAMGAAGSGTSALGISNDGNFYISANGGTPQKVSTASTSSYFSNLFQEDANDLGMYNSTTAQNLHVYSSYTNSSSWQRTSLGFDSGDGYAVLRSETSTGSAPGLGFWLNSGLKWVIDATSNLKPWTDQAYTIGSFSGTSGIGLRPTTVYAAGSPSSDSGFELGKFANNSYELCNDGTTGTQINGLAVLTSGGCAVKPSSIGTSGIIGVVIANAGTSGTTTLVRTGSAYCSFDGTATVVGDYVVASSTATGLFYPLCHDAGATQPAGVQVLGRVLQATAGGGVAQMFFDMPGTTAGSAGAVSSVFGRTGAVTAQSGDYSVAQITGAAAAASPALTGTPTAPTAAANISTTQIATTAFAHGVVPPDTSASVWITVPHASSAGTVFSSSASKAAFFGMMLGFQKTTSQVSYYVSTADASATTYDLGIYSGTSGGTCTLQAHTGSIAGSTAMTAGAHTANWTGGSVTLQPGRYYLALTASATSSTAVLWGDSSGVTFALI